ncbi:MAG: hypothetical protein KME16_02305 [Scytolyngbya sp. HA4215-MV1]|nr:hypothetical protein [Scytolyngbya sp. HA4215-MV1]
MLHGLKDMIRPQTVPCDRARSLGMEQPHPEIRCLSLRAFVQSALHQSLCCHYSLEKRLQLLDRAWEAQKLLWQLQAQLYENPES